MDLREVGEPFEKKFIQFSPEHVKDIAKTYHDWQTHVIANGVKQPAYKDVPEFCYSAKLEEVKKKDYSLVPSKYIEFINRDENINFEEKMKSLQTEMANLLKQEAESKEELLDVFKKLGYEI